jgi:hypothetical protein
MQLQIYDDWKRCIVEDCGIPLTKAFVERRLAALADRGDWSTQRFIDVWGERHLRRVLAWFERAARELGEAADEHGA